MDVDAIVVGAGPAGSSAALHLARRERSVLLLERHTFPRDKSCGDGLTRHAVRLLHEAGLLSDLPLGPPARGARILMRGKGVQDFRYPGHLAEPNSGTVIPRRTLDDVLCRKAVDAGATLWEQTHVRGLLYEDDVVVGVQASRGETVLQLRAPVVIAADGATSRLAYQAGLPSTPKDQLGYAIRGYYRGVEGLSDLLEIYMPLLDPTDRYLLPSYGWVFCVGEGVANIGVGVTHRERETNVRELFKRFLESLSSEPRFRGIELQGEWRGAAIRFDFRPDRCMAPGLLLVGDAAGMISPFTGEGIGYALESGRLAAEIVANALARGTSPLDLTEYPVALGRRFTGYFEAGRHSARRYRLIWHVLNSTFTSQKPLFDTCRRAALFPEGIGESYAREVLDDVRPFIRKGLDDGPDRNGIEASIRTDLTSIGELLIDILRRDWPFLSRVITAEQMVPGIPFRPALLLLLAGRIRVPPRGALVTLGAAIELGYLATLAQTSVEEDDNSPQATRPNEYRPANWGNMFALMVGDFLYGQAYAMTADVASKASSLIAESLSTSCEGHMLTLRRAFDITQSPQDYLNALFKKIGPLFELPCRMGAMLCGATTVEIDSLSTYGRHLGVTYQLVDEALTISGVATQFGRVAQPDLRDGVYALPILHVLNSKHPEVIAAALRFLRKHGEGTDEVYRLAREGGGVNAAVEQAGLQAEKAREALAPLTDSPVRTALLGLVDYALHRASAVRSSEDSP